MTSNSNSVVLPREIEDHIESYVIAMNAGDAEAVERHYTEEAVAVWEPGNPLSGDARRAYTKDFLVNQRPKMDAVVREAYVTGDTTLLVVDWKMEITGEDGNREQVTGVGLDVLRKQEDGSWLYAIDDPFGEEPRPAA
ncbi:YybH family protein [Streptomyces apocyni]|uniref:YybH family protein n=1 Tax=Streptomyces apocyni TaxID=2654677 RepID=UPI0012EA2D8C|nr:SgcJ/EcaC family oxidoreductase [Streptomyces apocyni]